MKDMKTLKTASSKIKKKVPKIIKFRQALFWDTDPKTIDPKKNARYIIERVLDFGMAEEITWLFHFYPRSVIRAVLNEPRSVIHKKSQSLWSLILK